MPNPKERHQLQHQLKELQPIQLWKLSKAEKNEGVQPVDDLIEKFDAMPLTPIDSALSMVNKLS